MLTAMAKMVEPVGDWLGGAHARGVMRMLDGLGFAAMRSFCAPGDVLMSGALSAAGDRHCRDQVRHFAGLSVRPEMAGIPGSSATASLPSIPGFSPRYSACGIADSSLPMLMVARFCARPRRASSNGNRRRVVTWKSPSHPADGCIGWSIPGSSGRRSPRLP